jgi:hypothetical protein
VASISEVSNENACYFSDRLTRCTRKLTTNDKMTANRIFDRKYRIYGQKKYSWIYKNSTSVNVYNTNKR